MTNRRLLRPTTTKDRSFIGIISISTIFCIAMIDQQVFLTQVVGTAFQTFRSSCSNTPTTITTADRNHNCNIFYSRTIAINLVTSRRDTISPTMMFYSTKKTVVPKKMAFEMAALPLSSMESCQNHNMIEHHYCIPWCCDSNLLSSMIVSTSEVESNTISMYSSMIFTTSSVTSLSSSPLDDIVIPVVPIIALVALTIGILANGWISRLISSEQGLGSFLSDGSGFNQSKFKPLSPPNKAANGSSSNKGTSDRAVQDDPLPWLHLPNFDFVEVAGQKSKKQYRLGTTTYPPPIATGLSGTTTTTTNDSTAAINTTPSNSTTITSPPEIALEELELLRLRMQEQVLLKNFVEAQRLRIELERLMKENNIQFTKEE